MPETILALFKNRDDAEAAIGELQRNGYNSKDISIVMKDTQAGREIASNTGANVASGAATGAMTGGAIGALAGLLIGIGAITIPGIGALLIGGPLAAALGLTGAAATTASGAATGALAGGLIGSLIGLGIPEEEARNYEREINEGAILLAVPATSNDGKAEEIMRAHNGTQTRHLAMTRSNDATTNTSRTDFVNINTESDTNKDDFHYVEGKDFRTRLDDDPNYVKHEESSSVVTNAKKPENGSSELNKDGEIVDGQMKKTKGEVNDTVDDGVEMVGDKIRRGAHKAAQTVEDAGDKVEKDTDKY